MLCSHGDVIGMLAEQLVDARLMMRDEVRLARGSTWLFDVRGDRIVSARHLAPIPEPES